MFSGAIDATKVSLGLGSVRYLHPQKNKYRSVSGSVSALFPSGVNVSLYAGQKAWFKFAKDRPCFYMGKIGYRYDFFNIGQTKFAVDYGSFSKGGASTDQQVDCLENGKGTTYAFMVVQDIKKFGTELYGMYRLYHFGGLKNKSVLYHNFKAFLCGARVKF